MEKNENYMEDLIGVRVGAYYYIGKAKGDFKRQRKNFREGACVELVDALELIVQHVPDKGTIKTNIHPIPIPPMAGPTDLPVNADIFLDLRRNESICGLYKTCIEKPPRRAEKPARESPILRPPPGTRVRNEPTNRWTAGHFVNIDPTR